MKQVLIAYEGFYRASGGVESHILDVIDLLPHRFSVLSDRFPTNLSYRGDPRLGNAHVVEIGPVNTTVGAIDVSRSGFPRRLLEDYLRLWGKAATARRGSWDVCHFQGANLGGAILRLARTLSSGRPAPTWFIDAVPRERRLLTVHGLSSELVPEAWIREIEAKVISRFDRVVCVDRHLVDSVQMIAHDHSFAVGTTFIPNGVDTERFAFRTLQPRAELRVGFVGRAEKSRGIDVLVEVARTLPKAAELHLVLAGSGRDLARIPEALLGRAARVRTNLPQDQMPRFYESIDVLLNPVLAKGISRITLEAMAVGRPVVMLKRGDRFPVIDGETGFLVRGAEDMAALMHGLLKDPEPLHHASRRARDAVERSFDRRVVLNQLEQIYQEFPSSE